MKKLVILSMALILGVFVGFALKPVPVTTKATNTVTTVGKKTATVTGKTNVSTTATKTVGTALSTTKVSQGDSKSVPSATVSSVVS